LTTYDFDVNSEALKALKKFAKSHRKYVRYSSTNINSVVNFVFFWDGSKEGWDISNDCYKLRKQFFNLARDLKLGDIYAIDHREDSSPELKHINLFHLNNLIKLGLMPRITKVFV